MKTITISGTPGTGKTTIANYISRKIDANVISLNEIAISEGFVSSYDENRDTMIIEETKLIKHVKNLIKKFEKKNLNFVIIEGHFADIIPEKFFNYIFILRCEPEVLYKRLKKRGYTEKKVIENVQSEILGNCSNYFFDMKISKPIFEIDTSIQKIKEIGDLIINIIENKINGSNYVFGKIDWLEKLSNNNQLSRYFD